MLNRAGLVQHEQSTRLWYLLVGQESLLEVWFLLWWGYRSLSLQQFDCGVRLSLVVSWSIWFLRGFVWLFFLGECSSVVIHWTVATQIGFRLLKRLRGYLRRWIVLHGHEIILWDLLDGVIMCFLPSSCDRSLLMSYHHKVGLLNRLGLCCKHLLSRQFAIMELLEKLGTRCHCHWDPRCQTLLLFCLRSGYLSGQ